MAPASSPTSQTADPSVYGSAESAARLAPRLSAIEEKGYRLDLAAYEGFDCGVLAADLRYFAAAVEAVGGTLRVQRTEYDLEKRLIEVELKGNYGAVKPTQSSMEWVAFELPLESLPIKLVPHPARLEAYLRSLAPHDLQKLNLPDITRPFDEYVQSGSAYARGVYFTPSPAGEEGRYWCARPEKPLVGAGWTRGQPWYYSPAYLGKMIGHDDQLARPLREIRLGDPGGAKLLGRMSVLGLNKGVCLVELEQLTDKTLRYLAYPVADGNGLPRRSRLQADSQSMGPYENSVRSPIHDPRLGRHSLLKAPLPQRPQAIGEEESALQRSPGPRRPSVWTAQEEQRFREGRTMKPPYPQERVVLTPPFAELDPPVVVLRKDEGWAPFREDYVLDNRLSFEGADHDTARLLCVFTSVSPKSLLELIGVLHNVEVTPLLKDEALLARLESLRPPQPRPPTPPPPPAAAPPPAASGPRR